MDQIEKKLKQLKVDQGRKLSKFGMMVVTGMVLVVFFGLGRGIAYFSSREKEEKQTGTMETWEKENEEKNLLYDTNGEQITIVVDAGHGGRDPGKVSESKILEKDINLTIAQKLKEALEAKGIHVVMTRDSDQVLSDETDKNQKMTDLNNRIELIKDNAPYFVISIHQNSYTDASVTGAQVFYLAGSEEGKAIAGDIQTSLNETIAFEKPREIKGNGSYYLLKKCPVTTVIVECGFLSNKGEAEKLTDDGYQNEIVNGILEGIMKYLEEKGIGNIVSCLHNECFVI